MSDKLEENQNSFQTSKPEIVRSLREIADKAGLSEILASVFPKKKETLFALSLFNILENKSLKSFYTFLEEYNIKLCKDELSTENIYEDLANISPNDRNLFYDLWEKNVNKDVWGKQRVAYYFSVTDASPNPDKKNIRSKKRALFKNEEGAYIFVFIEKSGLPSGIVKFKKKIITVGAIKKAIWLNNLTRKRRATLVLDNSFYEEKSLNSLIKPIRKIDFIMELPRDINLHRMLMDDNGETIRAMETFFEGQHSDLYSIVEPVRFDGNEVFAHMYDGSFDKNQTGNKYFALLSSQQRFLRGDLYIFMARERIKRLFNNILNFIAVDYSSFRKLGADGGNLLGSLEFIGFLSLILTHKPFTGSDKM